MPTGRATPAPATILVRRLVEGYVVEIGGDPYSMGTGQTYAAETIDRVFDLLNREFEGVN